MNTRPHTPVARPGPTHSIRPAPDLNVLRRGSTYRATTASGSTVGEYLGIEVPYGQRAILLRHADGIDSIAVGTLTSITPVAA